MGSHPADPAVAAGDGRWKRSLDLVILTAFGWLVPGGAYLLTRRYRLFAISAAIVWVTFGAGLALQGAYQWPQAAELHGLDGFTTLLFEAGGLAKRLAGGPWLFAQIFDNSRSFLDGRVHEYGTTLLTLAGLFNLLAISNTFDLRKATHE
jgi:hypothetical protein